MLRPSLSGRASAGLQLLADLVSPEFMLRPSLSVDGMGAARAMRHHVSPEFMLRPSLSGPVCTARELAMGVSPEFMLRPSLSVASPLRGSAGLRAGVAGVYAPAFVERASAGGSSVRTGAVSPEFMLRPSLSVARQHRAPPSNVYVRCVAGVYAPAFVERPRSYVVRSWRVGSSVAGVYAPAFVERSQVVGHVERDGVGVAGVYAPAFVERRTPTTTARTSRRCVAGVYAPAFVERDEQEARHETTWCRRSLCSGLR